MPDQRTMTVKQPEYYELTQPEAMNVKVLSLLKTNDHLLKFATEDAIKSLSRNLRTWIGKIYSLTLY
jgi:hypothetical protein